MILTPNKIKIFLFVMILIIIIINYCMPVRENFDSVGILNGTPNWFVKGDYHMPDWLVITYPDRIQPSCLPYSVTNKWGSLEFLNFISNTNQFWRI